MPEHTMEELYKKVDRLISLCERLKAENDDYRAREEQLLQERGKLMEKNELARVRVDSMIRHLKTLEPTPQPGAAAGEPQ